MIDNKTHTDADYFGHNASQKKVMRLMHSRKDLPIKSQQPIFVPFELQP